MVILYCGNDVLSVSLQKLKCHDERQQTRNAGKTMAGCIY